MVDMTEERVWKYLIKNQTATPEEVALNCDVTEDYARGIIDRIGTPIEVRQATAEQTIEARKDDADKVRIELVPPELLFSVGAVLTFGAKKYTTEIKNEWDALLYALCATELRVVTPRGDVVSVTRNTSASPIPSTQSASVKIGEIGRHGTRTEYGSWQSVDVLIRQLVQGTKEPNGSMSCEATDSQKKYTLTYAPKGAPSAALPNTCTLTIVTQQGNLEVSFAPDATMDSDFWATVWKGLREHFGISRPLNTVGDRNWEKGMSWGRVFGATMRHLWAWWGGKGPTTKNFVFGDLDLETGMSHLWHAGCCITFLITYEERGVGVDDRHTTQTGE